AYDPWDLLKGEVEIWRYRGNPSLGQPCAFSQPSPWADISQIQAAALLHPVAVRCQEAQMVVTVHRDLFSTGHLVKTTDLTLGLAACLHVAQNAAESTVTFVAGLHECGSTLTVTPDALVYSMSLNYNPVPTGNPVIVRTSPAVVPIACHYPSRDNVSSNGVKPTWAPFHSTLPSEEKLPFTLHLMNGDWSTERDSTVFQLGEVLHFQAHVNTENHAPLRLFVDSCVATPTPERSSSPQYAFIDFNGCLVDGQLDDATSMFISPRPRQDMLQFVVDAFKFAGDSSNLIYITCHLKVSLADQAPDPLNKACSFNKASNLWGPVEGTRDICSCCEMRSRGLARHSRRLPAPHRWQGGHAWRELTSQLDVVVGPLFIHSWQDHPVRRMPQQDAGHLWMVLVLAAVAGLVILILAVLGALALLETQQ
ncbi:ZP3 protein, partial [Eurystomus gularis]|nr:ZP3 protein [Eurystomus gularis]